MVLDDGNSASVTVEAASMTKAIDAGLAYWNPSGDISRVVIDEISLEDAKGRKRGRKPKNE